MEKTNLHRLFNQGPVVIFVWENKPYWSVSYVSDNVFEVFGYLPEEVQSSHFVYHDQIHPNDRDLIVSEVSKYTKNPKINYFRHKPYRINSKNGYIYVNDNTYIVRDEKGQVVKRIGYVYSVNEFLLAQKKLILAKNRAEEADQLKTAFLANISHELRTPLTSIIGFSELICETPNDAKKYAAIITDSARYLSKIIEEIVNYSLLKTDRKAVKIESVNLNSLLDEIHHLVSNEIRIKGLAFRLIKLLSDEQAFIATDSTFLKQILINLIQNAIKFTDNGWIEVRYKIVNNTLVFEVEDTGIGMTEKDSKRIFEKFVQLDNKEAIKNKGLGLGLSITKERIRLLDGKIHVKSKPNAGALFTFEIPYNIDASHEVLISGVQAQSNSSPSKGFNIMIVEDDDINFLLINTILHREGYHTIRAVTGLEAIEKVQNNEIVDLILMDVQLPLINGYEATEIIKKLKPQIAIIIQTANAFAQDKEKSFLAGCDAFVCKPLNKENLLKTIRYLLSPH